MLSIGKLIIAAKSKLSLYFFNFNSSVNYSFFLVYRIFIFYKSSGFKTKKPWHFRGKVFYNVSYKA